MVNLNRTCVIVGGVPRKSKASKKVRDAFAAISAGDGTPSEDLLDFLHIKLP